MYILKKSTIVNIFLKSSCQIVVRFVLSPQQIRESLVKTLGGKYVPTVYNLLYA